MIRAQEVISEAAPREYWRPEAAAALRVPALRGARLSPAAVLMLQRSAGNAAVAGLLRQRDREDEAQRSSRETESAPEQDSGSAQSESVPGTSAEGQQGPEEDSGEEVSLGSITIAAQEPIEVEVFAPGPTLRGKTKAAYTSTDAVISPNPPKASKAKGCPDCGDANCIRAKGTVSSTFSSNPTVTLPDLDGHDFTDCQRKNAEKFVQNVLSPHEQLHVNAFTTNFDGAWKKAFDLKVCNAEDGTAKIQAIYDAEFAARQSKADAASDALDAGGKNNFTWDMDAGCPKP